MMMMMICGWWQTTVCGHLESYVHKFGLRGVKFQMRGS